MKNFLWTVAGGLTVALVSHVLLKPAQAPQSDGSKASDYRGDAFGGWVEQQQKSGGFI